MTRPEPDEVAALKAAWTDKLVTADAAVPELARFAGRVGRVVTVNWNGRCIVDFQDGAWYDLDPAALTAAAEGKYDPEANSAQARPGRQG